MDLVDTHTHVVSKDAERYPLAPHGLPGEWYRKDPADAEDLAREMAAAGVAQAVLVQGVGAVGGEMARLLKERGARITICDIRDEHVAELLSLIHI